MKFLGPDQIEQSSHKTLIETDTLRLPVPVEATAERLGLGVELVPFGDQISGVLAVQPSGSVIGVNSAHSPVRRRFTIAHEIGHYVLHKDANTVFIDKGFTAVFRDGRSSKGKERTEIQANAFAAALLMPRPLVEKELMKIKFDLANEDALVDLASRFNVSQQALVYRLSNMDTIATASFV